MDGGQVLNISMHRHEPDACIDEFGIVVYAHCFKIEIHSVNGIYWDVQEWCSGKFDRNFWRELDFWKIQFQKFLSSFVPDRNLVRKEYGGKFEFGMRFFLI